MAARKISAVLIDLSGTLHVEDVATAGAIEALKKLRQTNVKMKFVTNTTKEPKRLLFERLKKIGFDVRQDEIFTSLSAASQLVQQRNLRPYYMLESSALEDFEGISSEDPNCVLVGLAPSAFNYDRMNVAFRLLLDGATLVAVHKGRYYKRKDGLALGPGAFVSGLEYAAGAKAEVVGKPESGFFWAALEGLEVSTEEAIMIGDDSRDDVGGAQAAGIRGILVKTGKYREGDETIINPPPTFLAQNFAEAVDYVMKNL